MNTQIYATFGPSCGSEQIIKAMVQAGMTGMRLNLSHTTLPESEAWIHAYQKAAGECGVIPRILIDMQGPELRIGTLEKPVSLKTGEAVILDDKIPIPGQVLASCETGDLLLLDDGRIHLRISALQENGLMAEVVHGGLLRSHKSIKIQGKNISMPVLTDHDLENIRLAKAYGITALMQPFVLSGSDLKHVRRALKENNAGHLQIFAKIENRIGVENLENIIPEADVIVIARGDLGNDMPLWELPAVQKEIESLCRKHHKPYLVVTQMLASMESTPVPTRAEVSDIFHAVYHGAYGVMITGESAIGKYPVQSVTYLKNTADQAEEYLRKSSYR